MSLFRPYNYKPKPDLPANAPVKHGFFLFFELFFRKFWRFLSLNIFYFLVTLPMLLFVYFTVNGWFADYLVTENGEFQSMLGGVDVFAAVVSWVPRVLHLPLFFVSLILYGPATMGLTYIFRNFAREEHAWLSDFVSRGKANFRQGLFFGLLDAVVIYLLVNGMVANIFTAAVPAIILRTLCVLFFVVYLFMRHYFYMIAVSVNLNVFAILKNAWLFVVLGFWRNLVSGLVCLGVTLLVFFTLPLVTLILLPTLYYSVTGFCVVFTCWPVVKRYIIVPAMEREAAEKGNGEEGGNGD